MPVRPRSVPAPVTTTPAFVQVKAAASADAQVASLGVTLDAAATAGNMLVAAACSDATITTPSGFTLAEDAVDAQGAYLWYKIAAGGETTITATPGVSRPVALVVAEYSGITASSPVDATNFAVFSGAPSTTATPGSSGTLAQAVELSVVVVCPHSFAENAQPASPSWSNSYTGRAAVTSGYIATGSQNSGVFLADLVTAATTATTSTATWAPSSQDYGTILATFKGA